MAMGSCPALRPVPIGFVASLQGQNGGVSPIRRSRGSLGSSPSQMQHHLHRVGAVLSAGTGSGCQWGPGYPGGSEELLLAMASCYLWSVWTPSAKPRLQVHLVPHQHPWL